MGISIRVFIVNEDDTLTRIPLSRYERLLKGDPEECFPQYAGKRIRYALAMVDLVNRKPTEILRMEYSMLSFDPNGKVDPAEKEKTARMAMDAIPPLLMEQSHQKVIDAQHHFAKKRYEREFIWTPSPEIETAINEAIFGINR